MTLDVKAGAKQHYQEQRQCRHGCAERSSHVNWIVGIGSPFIKFTVFVTGESLQLNNGLSEAAFFRAGEAR